MNHLSLVDLSTYQQEGSGRYSNDIGLYDMPNFYSSETGRTETLLNSSASVDKTIANGAVAAAAAPEGPRPASPASSSSMAQSCFSFLAFTAGLAAMTCALAAMVGTAWVDTWEPIDLPPVHDWPSLFGNISRLLTN